jgi:nicotinic acid phosphoribosyltransferase
MMMKIAELVQEIMDVHKVYCRVSVFTRERRVVWEVYISDMPPLQHFLKYISYEEACDHLQSYLDGNPKEHFERKKEEAIAVLRGEAVEIEEKIIELMASHTGIGEER